MAKITANGKTELARYLGTNPTNGAKATFVLRSDGAVLRKFRGEYGGGYSVLGKLKADKPFTADRLVLVAQRAGYTQAG